LARPACVRSASGPGAPRPSQTPARWRVPPPAAVVEAHRIAPLDDHLTALHAVLTPAGERRAGPCRALAPQHHAGAALDELKAPGRLQRTACRHMSSRRGSASMPPERRGPLP